TELPVAPPLEVPPAAVPASADRQEAVVEVAGVRALVHVEPDGWRYAFTDVQVAGRLVRAGTGISPEGDMWDTTDQDRPLGRWGPEALAQLAALAPPDPAAPQPAAKDPAKEPAPAVLWAPTPPEGEPDPWRGAVGGGVGGRR